MQHLSSNYREEDVADEVPEKDLLHREAEGADVGSLGIFAATGGIRPRARSRLRLALTMAEREEISRGVIAGYSIRVIAGKLGRAPSTVSREIRRNGGRRRYRANKADEAAWDRARRPKTCKLVENREPGAGPHCGTQAQRAVVAGTDCWLAQVHVSGR